MFRMNRSVVTKCCATLMPATALLLSMFAAGVVRADAVDFESQTVTIALAQEPPNLNSLRMTDLVSFFVIGHVNSVSSNNCFKERTATETVA